MLLVRSQRLKLLNRIVHLHRGHNLLLATCSLHHVTPTCDTACLHGCTSAAPPPNNLARLCYNSPSTTSVTAMPCLCSSTRANTHQQFRLAVLQLIVMMVQRQGCLSTQALHNPTNRCMAHAINTIVDNPVLQQPAASLLLQCARRACCCTVRRHAMLG
jgi:hypothetical protein